MHLARIAMVLFGAAALLEARERPPVEGPMKIEVTEVTHPAERAKESAWMMDENGRVLVAWVEAAEGRTELKTSTSEGDFRQWSVPTKVDGFRGDPQAEILGVASGGGGRWLVWWVEKRGEDSRSAQAVETRDGGRTWGASQPIGPEEGGVGAAAVASGLVGKGAWRVAWTLAAAGRSVLMAGDWPAGGTKPERAAGNATARGALSAAVFPDGTFLLSYRGYNDDGAADPWLVAQRDGKWQEPVRIGREGWLDTPAEAPAATLTAAGSHAGAVWFTASDDEPRVLAAVSPDAGTRWTQSQRADLRYPTGPVTGLMRRDGSHLAVWTEGPGEDESMPGGVWLRRYNSGGGTLPPTLLVPWREVDRARGLALREPRIRGQAESEPMLGYAAPGGGLRLKRLRLPTRAVLEEIDRNCGCGARASGDDGVAVKGRIEKVDTTAGRVLIAHDPVPGVLRGGQLWVRVLPQVAAALREGRGFLGKLEEREEGWWLGEVRMFATLP